MDHAHADFTVKHRRIEKVTNHDVIAFTTNTGRSTSTPNVPEGTRATNHWCFST